MHDIRSAFRSMALRPWFTLAIVTTLGLGIGINTTVFTLVNAVLFRPLPFPEGERIVTVANVRASAPDNTLNLSYLDFVDLRNGASSFDGLEAAAIQPLVLGESAVPPELVRTARVTPGLLDLVGTRPELGRPFGPGDATPGAPTPLIIGHHIWTSRYGGDPDVIGRPVRVDDRPATIVGIMPAGFRFPNREDVWIPLVPTDREQTNRGERNLLVVGRLENNTAMTPALQSLRATADRLATEFPATNEGIGIRVMTFNERFNGGEIRIVFLLMLAAVGFLLLIACANVANLMLSRTLTRRREMAVRSALGAPRWRLMRQLLVESLALSAVGGVIGLGLAALGIRAFDAAVENVGKPSWIIFSIDYVVLAYVATICVVSGLVFGLAPALRSSRVALNAVLKDGGRGGSSHRSRLSTSLVVVQFALAVVLMAGAGLLIRSFLVSQQVDPFIPRDHILTARVVLSGERYEDRDGRVRFLDELRNRLTLVPGVTHAALTVEAPGQGGGGSRFELDGALVDVPADREESRSIVVSSGYFSAINLPILRGRDFNDRDGLEGFEAAVVTRQFAERYWPNRNPLGLRLRFNQEQTPGPWLTVVGITDDLVQRGQTTTAEPLIFIPVRQAAPSSLLIFTRTEGDPTTLSGPVRSEVQRLDPDLPLADVRTLEEVWAQARWPYRVFGTAFGLFALTALVMAGVGLYAVMAQATLRRTREIGIRMALGATPGRVLRIVITRGIVQLVAGLVLGLALAFFTTGAMRVLLFGVTATDPVVLTVTTVTLVAIGLAACALPAWRAATLAPVTALRTEER